LPASGCEMIAKLRRRATSSKADKADDDSGELIEIPQEKHHYKGHKLSKP
jgi:hypothetical protein